ncbi:DUF4271 domain-containing protein [Sediminicola luteus]|uniref:DUF4271 domain-containing protein n=1 Tax=Sediminicola luteus TaxID=319238 RepID=A0A2A4G417_9FLAO|nr:DUF4271 domain-containing protein [Sediminicola luteus]PCE62718.1 DUF4271 domain-containing protein [Sediminicola luteus]
MEPLLRNVNALDWISLALLASLVFLSLAKAFFPIRFQTFLILPFNNKYIFIYNKKDKLANWFHMFIMLFSLCNLPIYAYYTINILELGKYTVSPGGVWWLLLFSILYIGGKFLLQLLNGLVFNINPIVNEAVFKKMAYLNYSGLIMFMANIILTYMAPNAKVLIYISLLLVVAINTIGWVTTIRNHQKFLGANIFYFILYLCTLEIAPVVIVGSYLKD